MNKKMNKIKSLMNCQNMFLSVCCLNISTVPTDQFNKAQLPVDNWGHNYDDYDNYGDLDFDLLDL